MKFGSVCSGIEAASVAFNPLGWEAEWLAEIEPFPSSVLAHHYPKVPNLGDMTAIADRIDDGEIAAPDLLCGGCPCQSFSVAGLRKSLSDQRGNLTLEFIRIADAIDRVRRAAGKPPAWVLYENVPGILSTADNAFGSFLGGLCGGDAPINAPADGWPGAGVVAGPSRVVAWRVLDAQYFGVAQRRRRVFVLALGGAGGWACADALLSISDSLSGHPAPRRETGQRPAPTLSARTQGGGGLGTDFDLDGGLIQVTPTLNATYGEQTGQDFMNGLAVPVPPLYSIHAHCIGRAPNAGPQGKEWLDDGSAYCQDSRSTAQAIAFGWQNSAAQGDSASEHYSPTLDKSKTPAVAIQDVRGQDKAQNGKGWSDDGVAYTVDTIATQGVQTAMQIRRLTPEECEALQGFPRGYTAVPHRGKPAADGPRYKALGNSWAVPCAAWIGRRINQVESIRQLKEAA